MNKQKFQKISSNPDNINSKDISALVALSKAHPYSQIIHTLLAKAHSIENKEGTKEAINFAAMYATDRQLLKELVTSKKPEVEVKKEKETKKPKQELITKKEKETKTIAEQVIDAKIEDSSTASKPKQKKITIDTSSFANSPSTNLRNEILTDLDQLKNSKAHYLQTLKDSEDTNSKKSVKKPLNKTITAKKIKTEAVSAPKKTTKKKAATPTKAASAKKAATKKTNTTAASSAKASKSKTTTVKRAASSTKAKTSKKTAPPKAKSTTKTTVAKSKSTTQAKAAPKTASVKAKAPRTVSSKKATASKAVAKKEKTTTAPKTTAKSRKKKPEQNSKVEEQQKIIDNFIDKEPSISSKPVLKVASEQKDLSEDSTNFGEDLISENLAMILVDQKKTQKAIDMYKKLIWKFPQKKTYFAARIQELKK